MEHSVSSAIGFMQGRLAPMMNGKIQAFPWPYWREEFPLAAKHGFQLMEWTLDQERLYENPLMTNAGREQIQSLSQQHGMRVRSLTGDCFMQAPFYKVAGKHRQQLLLDLTQILEASGVVGIQIVLIPLVDHGRLENQQQERDVLQTLIQMMPVLEKTRVMISFESDFPPQKLADFIDHFDPHYFGITYDIGNSAALGYNPEEEIKAYGYRIVNVHVKDRLLGGTTVPLGTGHADIPKVLRLLRNSGYAGNYILQTARASDGNHAGVLCHYRDMVVNWLAEEV